MTESGSDEGRLFAVYLMEAVRLVEDIRTGIDRLDAYWAKQRELYKEATDSVLVVDPVIQKDLQIVISDIARLYNLFSHEPPSKKCTYKDVSKERTSYFRDLLGSISLSAMGSRAARNSLEHFEERVHQGSALTFRTVMVCSGGSLSRYRQRSGASFPADQ